MAQDVPTRLGKLTTTMRKLPSYLNNLSNIGIIANGDVDQSRLGVSRRESDRSDPLQIEEFAGVLADLYSFTHGVNSHLPYYNKSYKIRRDEFHIMAAHPEIEFIVHTIANEAIVYDEYGYFCKPRVGITLQDDISKKINSRFNQIYNMYSFNEGDNAWALFLRWLTEGHCCFEIHWDDINNPKEITGFTELDASEMYETYRMNAKNQKIKVWVQKTKGASNQIEERILPDNCVVFISYNKVAGSHGMISYVERLQRSFNLLRTVENTRVAWNLMNSMFRLKLIIPVGSKTTTKAKQAIATVMSKYREDLVIDHKTGIPTINGQPNFNFAKNIIMPSRGGESPEIEGIKYEGADLSDMEIARYFEKKLQKDSWLPFSRFDREGGSGTSIIFGADGIPHDEQQFYRFINRMRSEFQRLLLKPLYLQVITDMPVLKMDQQFKSRLGIIYDSNNQYELAKRYEEENRAMEKIEKMQDLKDSKGKSVFAMKWLMKKYYKMSQEDIDENQSMLDEENGNGGSLTE